MIPLARQLVLLAMLSPVLGPLQAQVQSPLNRPQEIVVGDMVALMISEFLKLRTDLTDPTIVTYEADPGVIDVEVFARTALYGSKTDKAREVLGKYWDFIQTGVLPYVQRRWSVQLTAEHFRLVYYDTNAQGGPKAILAFVGGQYLLQ